MNNQTKKFFIYTRKSTDDKDRQVRSISDQLSELKELALKEQLEVIDVFVEKQTAKIPGRPVFNEMIERMEKGEASGILSWHPDRLASINEKLFGLIIHRIVLANDEPRGAWKILSDSEFFGGNAEQTALRADHIFRSDSDFIFWRCILDKVRMYFADNPNAD